MKWKMSSAYQSNLISAIISKMRLHFICEFLSLLKTQPHVVSKHKAKADWNDPGIEGQSVCQGRRWETSVSLSFPRMAVLSGDWDVVGQRGQKGIGCKFQEYQEVKRKEGNSCINSRNWNERRLDRKGHFSGDWRWTFFNPLVWDLWNNVFSLLGGGWKQVCSYGQEQGEPTEQETQVLRHLLNERWRSPHSWRVKTSKWKTHWSHSVAVIAGRLREVSPQQCFCHIVLLSIGPTGSKYKSSFNYEIPQNLLKRMNQESWDKSEK